MKQLALLVLPLLLSTPVQAAEPASIGYVDMQVVIDKSKMGQQAQQVLNEKISGKEKEVAEEKRSISQQKQKLDRDKALMSQAELDKKTAELKQRMQTFQRNVAQMQQELLQEQNKLGNQILEPAQAIIAAVAKEKQVTVVFERRQSGLLYIDEGLDLTAEVVKRLDAQEKK